MSTYDLATVIGKIRLLIGDTSTTVALLEDNEITAFYTMAGTVYGAASLALMRIANDKSLVGKAIKAGNYSEDASKFVDMLINQADKYNARDVDVAAEADSETIVDEFSYNNILVNRALRDEDFS